MGRLYVPDILREDLEDVQYCCRFKVIDFFCFLFEIVQNNNFC